MKRILFLFVLTLACLHVAAQNFELRLLNHWDNPNGTVERGYAGSSIWKWNEIPTDIHKKMPRHLINKYKEYARINRQFGINGTVLNNVNAKPEMLSTDMLQKTARIADILRPYGIRVYLSVNFASPKALGGLSSADPLLPEVNLWWREKAKEIYELIPDFGGFLVKANSEGEPGPMDYGRTHVDGANMLADALAPYGGLVMWRSFVYSAAAPNEENARVHDRANQAYDEFVRFDGQFRDNVIIQIKNGPIDFQPREAVSPLFFALKKTKMMVEFQITQEYTGHSIQTCYLAPMWQEFFETIRPFNINLVGVAGVSNIGDAGWKPYEKDNGWHNAEWTANELAMANWYAFGRLAQDPRTDSEQIARDYLRQFYTKKEAFVEPMTQLLMQSREAMVNYMMPLGLHHIFAGGHHYGPEPWCEPRGWRMDWLPKYYHKAEAQGVGFDRTERGSNNVGQYPEPLRSLYKDAQQCPEELLLWFHHLPWTYQMHNGRTLWDNLCLRYDEGVRQAQSFAETWRQMKPYVKASRWQAQMERFERQARDAQWWKDACLGYFQEFSRLPLPTDIAPLHYSYPSLRQFNLPIDNYSVARPEQLP